MLLPVVPRLRYHAGACGGLLALLLLSFPAWGMEAHQGIDPQAGLPSWTIHDAGMSLRLVQRLPDQTRGFLMARGFTAAQAERVAVSCVFQTDFRNIASDDAPLSYDLHDWIVHFQGEQRQMKLREEWVQEWQRLDVPPATRTAFEWGMYPTAQTYQPGDYNWGISVFNLPPGARFDLEVVWRQFGRIHRYTMRDIQCAPDIHPDPAAAGE